MTGLKRLEESHVSLIQTSCMMFDWHNLLCVGLYFSLHAITGLTLWHVIDMVLLKILTGTVQPVDYYSSRGSYVFACFVDFQKAFDKVNYWKSVSYTHLTLPTKRIV